MMSARAQWSTAGKWCDLIGPFPAVAIRHGPSYCKAEAIMAQFKIESEKLRHHSITEMLLERDSDFLRIRVCLTCHAKDRL